MLGLFRGTIVLQEVYTCMENVDGSKVTLLIEVSERFYLIVQNDRMLLCEKKSLLLNRNNFPIFDFLEMKSVKLSFQNYFTL